MSKMHSLLMAPMILMIGSIAEGQTAAPVPNVQTGQASPATAVPPASSDPSGITPADSGSAIDKPATVGAMPQTGYHPPVIDNNKSTEPLPHQRVRAAAQGTTASDAGRAKARTTSRKHSRSRR
jgi:hypothetical protein